MRSYLIYGTIAVVFVVVAVAMAFYEPPVSVEATEARTGPISEFVDQQAKTRLPRVSSITMPYAARIEEIDLIEGEPVTQGQRLAQVATADLDFEVAEAQAVVDRLTEAIRENQDLGLEHRSREQAMSFVESMLKTVAAADARKESGKIKMDYNEAQLTRIRGLAERGAVPLEELERAELDFQQSKVNYRQDNLVAESIRAIEAATRLLPQMVDDYIVRKDLRTEVLLKEKAEAEARLRQALLRKDRGTMCSPIDGIVLAVKMDDEQFVQAGTELVSVGDLNQLEVEADFLSVDVTSIEPGDRVEIYGAGIGAVSELTLPARVQRVHPEGFTKISSLGVEQQRVRVVMEMDDATRTRLIDLGIGVDFRVRVRVFTDARDNAVLVPRSCLFRAPDNSWQLFTIQGGRAQQVAVDVGLMNDDVVQIVRGVSAGDRVIMAPDNQVASGVRVAERN